ncbi:DUF6179 domain-containing protein [Clostridium saccharobutylicum]|uniref:Uncharacterized protein n=1 Tax=Clostridium saccharobutylicum TaxID=169679 RepID=A0A1S8NDF6_CLOSA|nr:DUF6179 domain-containing protein [Clostridium saccharobutylicum]OOM05848.1 hypothetical protein CLOSAC_44270 [Clostridium saccharobutylicum]OOM14460.1 hypothetical protein CLOSAC_13400 [Clostridium saccharobutylicum]
MDNGESIQKYGFYIENNFSEEYFFKDILMTCYEKELLDDKILKRISYERLENLKVHLKYYTKDESSSIMVEVAESLMEGIDYTIGIYLKTFDNIELIVNELKNTSLFEMLKNGHDLIKKKTAESKKLLDKIQKNKLKVDNYAYNDTIDYGYLVFFKEYDDFFVPNKIHGPADYQLYVDNINYSGIEYIKNYLETLNLENEFCYNFDINKINKLLKGYDKKCEVLIINIFELVLINSLGLIICGKSLDNLTINNIDREHIKNKLNKLSLEELQVALLQYANRCCEILNIKNKALVNYIRKSMIKITSLINTSIELNRLEKVFISFDENSDNKVIEYTDGKKLSNSVFRKLSEKIRESSSIEDKVALIKNNIKSLEDLVDILGAECLFEDQYIMYFKSLSQMEIILLSKYVSDISFEDEYEKEWYVEFNKYMSSLNQEEQVIITELKERIQLS